jgi:PAS domain S-box-containing protein
VRPRQIAPVALIIGLAVAGFFGSRLLGERDARRDSERRAEVAAVEIRGRIEQGGSLAESLRRFMVGVAGSGVTSQAFESNASRWLSPAGFPAAAWVEQVPASRRAAYERRTGQPIVARDRRGRIARVGLRSFYLPAALVSGIPPTAVPGMDLGGESGMAVALARARARDEALATPLATRRDGTKGLFLVRSAPRLTGGAVLPGFVVVFVSDVWLRAATTDTATVRLTTGGSSTEDRGGAATARSTFTQAGQRFDVVVPQESVSGAAAVLPWIILGAGLFLAALAGALAVNAARRAKAQDELDRIFTLTPDLITVADFDGHIRRVNPAVEQVLGYTEEEFLSRPYLEVVHPDDREKTAAEAAAISLGRTTLSFENRFVRKDGSYRVLEWTTTPVVEERLMYGVARDVTERRQAETELGRLVGEQAALRRLATLVAHGAEPRVVFDAVCEETGRVLGASSISLDRFTPDGFDLTMAGWSVRDIHVPAGTRLPLDGDSVRRLVRDTAALGRFDSYEGASGALAALIRQLGICSEVGAPVFVEGRVWGALIAASDGPQPLPVGTEHRLASFAEMIATAVSNADARSELLASRVRIVEAADEQRRRVVRDLHDGAQSRLIHTVIALERARTHDGVPADVKPLVEEGLTHARSAIGELRELAHGIHPSILSNLGLAAAIEVLADRAPLPVEVEIPKERYPAAVESAAYFVAAEALTNVTKYARASRASITASRTPDGLRLVVEDDGVGGARRAPGGGLAGLGDRLAALQGGLAIYSAPGHGTRIRAEIPLPALA